LNEDIFLLPHKHTFDDGSEAVSLNAVAEVILVGNHDETVCVIDEKHGVYDIVFLGEISERFSHDGAIYDKNSRK
jgi:Rad3-related DNA helicase